MGKEEAEASTQAPPLFDLSELGQWSLYRGLIAEFVGNFLFVFFAFSSEVGYAEGSDKCATIGVLGISLSFGGMVFLVLYCIAGVSGGNVSPAVTFGLVVARMMSVPKAVLYMASQCLGCICGAGVVKLFNKEGYLLSGGGSNYVQTGYSTGDALGAEILGTFFLLYVVFAAIDPDRRAKDAHVSVNAPFTIGVSVFLICLSTIPISGTGIHPARSLAAAIFMNRKKIWDDLWIFWVGPFLGAGLASAHHQYIMREPAARDRVSYCSIELVVSTLIQFFMFSPPLSCLKVKASDQRGRTFNPYIGCTIISGRACPSNMII